MHRLFKSLVGLYDSLDLKAVIHETQLRHTRDAHVRAMNADGLAKARAGMWMVMHGRGVER